MKSNIVPVVSIILTVYNRQEYLKRCVDSIIHQSFKDWEVIAIDDGSEDGSVQILEEYEVKFHNVRLIKQDNIKLARSRNRGIEVAGLKYLTFIDSDDEYSVDHIQRRVDFMEANKNVDFIHGGVKIIGNEYVRDKNDPHKFIHLSECSIGGTFFGRTEVFRRLNGFRNIPYSEDSDFLERAEKLFNIRKVNFDTYIYHRESENSITNSYVPQ